VVKQSYIIWKISVYNFLFFFSETISASDLTEESKLSILNKENQNIKANGYYILFF